MPHDPGISPGALVMLANLYCYLHPQHRPHKLAAAISAALIYAHLATPKGGV